MKDRRNRPWERVGIARLIRSTPGRHPKMSNGKNTDLKKAIASSGFHSYEIAAYMGITPEHLSRKLNGEELPHDEFSRILGAVSEMMSTKGGDR